MAGKVTVGLASHWPRGTDFSGLSTYGLNGHGKGDKHLTYTHSGMVHFTFFIAIIVRSSSNDIVDFNLAQIIDLSEYWNVATEQLCYKNLLSNAVYSV